MTKFTDLATKVFKQACLEADSNSRLRTVMKDLDTSGETKLLSCIIYILYSV